VAPLLGRSSSSPTWTCSPGADFFTVEVLTWRGLVTYYVLFFIEVGRRRVSLGGITRHPDACWMEQLARNATMQDTGYLNGCRHRGRIEPAHWNLVAGERLPGQRIQDRPVARDAARAKIPP